MMEKVADLMAVEMARALKGRKNVFHGLASPLPMVAIHLAKRLHNPDITYLNITGGVNIIPETYRKSTDSYNLFEGTVSSFNLTDIFDLAARGELDVAFLSGVQIDKYGNANNSVIGDYKKPKVRLPGGAGSAVLIPNVHNAYLWRTKHDSKSMVEKVDFITAAGNVKYVFTPLCTFEKVDGELKLIRISPYTNMDELQENTGFKLDFGDVQTIDEPTPEELDILSKIDPEKIRYTEFK